MDEKETLRLAETVEEGMSDGRSLESLRMAMVESGYNDEDIHNIIAQVDRKRTVRRTQRKPARNWSMIASAVVIIGLIIIVSGLVLLWPAPKTLSTLPTNWSTIGNVNSSPAGNEIRTCYVVDEEVKEKMLSAGAKCDKWFLLKEI